VCFLLLLTIFSILGRKGEEGVDLLVVVDLLETEVEVEALAIVVGMIEETIEEGEVVEVASTATGVDTWREIVLMKTAEEKEEVVSEEEEVEAVAAELATIVTKKDIWQENVPKKTAGIVEDDR